jgi:hypothetical protein
MDEGRPSWQMSACSAWCVREHRENDIDGARDHTSEGTCVPVMRSVVHWVDDELQRELIPDEVIVATLQAQEDLRPTITVGLPEDARVQLDLVDESAERLLVALRTVIEQAKR